MPKNKRPAPRKPAKPAAEPDHEALAQNLVDLALDIVETDPEDLQAAARKPQLEQDLLTLIRRALRRQHDEILYGAIEAARYTDPECCRYLQEQVEEEAATLRLRDQDGDGAELEIDAFMIPMFVSSTGGLNPAEVFQDDAAFEELSDSFRHTGLASADSRVVLVRYLYDLDEVDHVGYSGLQQMLKEAAASMRSKKLVAAPAIEASMRGWHASGYGPDDEAMELRFLLGFSLKHADDPFYKVPKDEAAADAYFEGRMARYRMWAGSIAPLLARCLSPNPAKIELNFLYQDLFYGAKEQGVSELAMLATLAEVNGRIDDLDLEPERLKAVVAPVDLGTHAALRTNLYPLAGGAPLATIDKPLDLAADLESEVEDLCDGLSTIGLDGILLARGFDEGGQPEGAEAYLSD
ncbi:hypothetical protein AB595_12315 [Massilia sp. WF1]|uniref:DUF2863 family protein n=1 Tax=unclassified Massilia TaxID=2609279 RepID=UPI000649F623|nr:MULTISPECIES: DUF2863 family protein [unclassified Massilia]ALK97374.1 hypothetical protein AM586_15195 [Massilia sp. WG5]KLU36555.1 hypothetical protein AB595_12315 [Massilia sp. WF1]